MHKSAMLLPLAGVLFLAGCGQHNSQPTTVPGNAVKVHVTATDYKWTLDKKDFQVGVPIDFIVKSGEGTHGFSIVQENVAQSVASGQKPVNIVWTPKKAGTYVIKCNVYCGSGHDNMWTKIQVQG